MAGIGFGNWSVTAAGKLNRPSGPYQPHHVSVTRRLRKPYTIRRWSVRHSRFLEAVYATFSRALLMLHPFWAFVGYGRAEAPVKFVERRVKGLLFDCRMCGQCILSSTGMSCPMNCPKRLRNGPCGGVRANGHCEIEPDMPCVWVQAWEGSRSMRARDAIFALQPPVDYSLRETSAWLRATAEAAAEREREVGSASPSPAPSPSRRDTLSRQGGERRASGASMRRSRQ